MSRRLPVRAAAPLAAVGILALAGLGAAQTGPGRDLLATWGVSAPAEPYTEIAFTQPSDLPRTPTDGVATVPFEVRNAEGAVQAYRWAATTRSGGGDPVRVAGGRLRLDDGAGVTVRARIPVTCGGERVRVDVSLGGDHRTIGFWTCDGRTS